MLKQTTKKIQKMSAPRRLPTIAPNITSGKILLLPFAGLDNIGSVNEQEVREDPKVGRKDASETTHFIPDPVGCGSTEAESVRGTSVTIILVVLSPTDMIVDVSNTPAVS
jgi:hypothetical protein